MHNAINLFGSSLPAARAAKPFTAPSASVIRFLPDDVVSVAATDYHNDTKRWRLRHLPLIVGSLQPESLPRLSGAPGSPEILLLSTLRSPDFGDCARRLTRRVGKLKGRTLRDEIAADNLVHSWSSLAAQVLAFDRHWFGPPEHSYLLLHRETIIPPSESAAGQGRFVRSGTWHRDGTTSRQGGRTRIYLMRSSHPMRLLPNALTEGMPNNGRGDMQGEAFRRLAAQNSSSPQPGEIVLINGGSRIGTAHASMRPRPWEGGQSLFFALTCYAP